MMSPTEILAEQHFLTLARLLEPSKFKAVPRDRSYGGEGHDAIHGNVWQRVGHNLR